MDGAEGPQKAGRPANERANAYRKKYGLSDRYGWSTRVQTGSAMLDQLDRCKDDAARRLILGKSKKKPTPEE